MNTYNTLWIYSFPLLSRAPYSKFNGAFLQYEINTGFTIPQNAAVPSFNSPQVRDEPAESSSDHPERQPREG